jgi:hypothetical protein
LRRRGVGCPSVKARLIRRGRRRHAAETLVEIAIGMYIEVRAEDCNYLPVSRVSAAIALDVH